MNTIAPDESDLADIKNNIMNQFDYTVGQGKLRIPFKDFIPQLLYCGLPITYSFKLQSGDALPKFITAGNFLFTKGGYVDIIANTRKILPELMWTILITGEVP